MVLLDFAGIMMNSLDAPDTQFGFDLFKRLNNRKNGNIFFSPVGMSTAVGMLLLGSGDTSTPLQKVGRLPNSQSPKLRFFDPWSRTEHERCRRRTQSLDSLSSESLVPTQMLLCHLLLMVQILLSELGEWLMQRHQTPN